MDELGDGWTEFDPHLVSPSEGRNARPPLPWWERDGFVQGVRARSNRSRAAATQRKPLCLLSVADLLGAPARSYLFDGLLAAGELSVWWGAPKSGKSFLLLRLAWGLALGMDMWGRRVERAVRVIYVSAEGAGGLGNRVRALCNEIGEPGPNLIFCAQRIEVGPPSADLDALVERAREFRADLIVLDTLARTFGEGNEDTAQDMGGFVAACDRLREETGAHIAVVHHGSKDPNGKTPRGSGSLLGAADLVVHVQKPTDQGDGHAVVEMAKDDVEGAKLTFSLRVVPVGERLDGSTIESCVADDSSARKRAAVSDAKLTRQEQFALRFLHDLLARRGKPLPSGSDWPSTPGIFGVEEARWREECEARSLSASAEPDNRRRVISRAMEGCRNKGAVAFRDGIVWAVREPGRP